MKTTTKPVISASKIKNDLGLDRKTLNAQQGGNSFPLRIAVVRRVDYEAMRVDLLAVGPGNDDQYLNVPLTFPSAGRRNFMGVMPEVGDNCIIGYAPKESGHFRQPYILGWLVPGALAGYNWLTTQPHSPDELSMDPANKFRLEGVFSRARQKLRHLNPGNAFISSSQGSDLVLDESVTLANRRGNELILRDQDQALIVRTLQQFHAGAGFRVYGGMVQRDAQLLLRSVVSDGRDWTGPQQIDKDGNTIPSSKLPASTTPNGVAVSDSVFDSGSGVGFPSYLNPFSQYERAQFTLGRTVYTPQEHLSDAVSGGKPLYRVGLTDNEGSINQAANNPASKTLTEYRIEVAHTTDGTLPVTEQTDGFEVDRLPESAIQPGSPASPSNPNAAFVEFVLGTAIENDFTNPLYGLPLAAQIFYNGDPSPSVYSAQGLPITEQLAVFLRVKDPTSPTGSESFLTLTKGGTLRGYFGAADILIEDDLNLTALGALNLSPQGSFSIGNKVGRPTDNVGIELKSESGAIVISAGGSNSSGAQTAAVTGTESSLPGLTLSSQTNTLVSAQRQVQLSAPDITLQDAANVSVKSSSRVNFETSGSLVATAKTISVTSLGRAEYTFGGPKDSQATNAPLRVTKFTGTPLTGFPGGTADEYSIQFGDLVEKIAIGNRKTKVTTGDILFETTTGTTQFKAGLNTLSVKNASVEAIAKQGPVKLESSTDAMTLLSTRTMLLKSRQKVDINAPIINFSVTGADFAGGVLTDGCIDGLTGQPFRNGGTFGSNQIRMVSGV